MLGVATGNPLLIIDILWFIFKLVTIFLLFRGSGKGGGGSNDNDIGGGGDFGGGGSSNKW